MKTTLFITYPLRSLRRGGASTRLAILCIAIGVMAVVAIQLTGLMATTAYVHTARAANGGDISAQVINRTAPFTPSNLAVFARLQSAGTIQAYTPVNLEQGAIGALPAPANGLLVQVVDPQHFPLVSSPVFISPASGSLRSLLVGNQIVVTRTFLTYYHMQIGARFDLHMQAPKSSGTARILHARIAGVIANTGMYPAGNTFVLVSFATYQATDPAQPVTYDSVDITTPDQSQVAPAINAIQQQVQQGHLPPVSLQTATEVQRQVQIYNNQTTQLQELAGLLVLLIAGLGIMNTMRVLLARRTLEIAMLKTAGYTRANLALLFGIEASVLGLLGGLLGTGAAFLISYGVVQTLLLVPFQPDPLTLAGGLALGTCTALCFGLVPLVQSASLRPIEVMRSRAVDGASSKRLLTFALYTCVVCLFCLLASLILGNPVLASASVCGVVAFLGLFSLALRPLLRGISALPIPDEPPGLKFLALVLAGMFLAAILCNFFPIPGSLLLVLLLLALVFLLLPSRWRSNIRMALRDLNRRPARANMLVLLLFVAVFVIGSIQVIGQDLQSQLTTTMNQALAANVIVQLPRAQAPALQRQLAGLPGLLSTTTTTTTATSLEAINNQPWQRLLPSTGSDALTRQRISQVLSEFAGVEGYDLAHQHQPDPALFQIVAGRTLDASDAGTNHVLVPSSAAQAGSFAVNPGNLVTLKDAESGISTTVAVVGTYKIADSLSVHVSPVLAPQSLVITLAPKTAQAVYYLKVDPALVAQVEAMLVRALPGIAFVPTPASNTSGYLQGVASITQVFTAIIGFVLLIGMLILANTVLLDLLERRRELGIMKALGYTWQALQGEILLEYSLVGATGALLAVICVALFANLLGNLFLNATTGNLGRTNMAITMTFSLNGWLLAGLIAGTLLIVLLTSLLASWRIVRRPPLEVLRDE